ncbi:MAG: hypothetical protein SVR94_04220, partial [Pseudomonadota bacterium]|nr:hypothetical protein [Pseudomonadota bacterium]
ISTTELRQMDPQSRWQWFMQATQGDKTASGAVQSQMFIDIFRAHIQALLAYQPQPWKGKALYFRAMERSGEVFWEQFWRSQVQGGLELYFIPGNHLTMNEEPNVHYLAHYLQSQLTIIHHEGEQNDI